MEVRKKSVYALCLKCLIIKRRYIARTSFRFLSLLVSRSPMYIRRKSKPKPWMAKKKGRSKPSFAGASVSQSNPLYKTTEWESTRRAVLQRYPICYWCEAVGLIVESTDADHIQPSSSLQSRSAFFDQENIVGSCRSCNSRRASYSAKGVYLETKEEWAAYLKTKRFLT